MADCNINEAIKLVEQLYKTSSTNKESRYGRQALKEIFEAVNQQRALLQEAGVFAGAESVSIVEPVPAPVDYTPVAVEEVVKDTTEAAPRYKTKQFGNVTFYFFPKGSKELKGALAFTKYDEEGNPFVVMQEGITKSQVIEYIQGRTDSNTSVQKLVVNSLMESNYGIDLVAELSRMNDKQIREFIVKHELSHINNSDTVDVYYADKRQTIARGLEVTKGITLADENNKYLSDSAVIIETRANIEALNNSLKALVDNQNVVSSVDVFLSFHDSLAEIEDDTPPWDVEEETVQEPVTETQEETKAPAEGYKISGNMTTNKGQTFAINTMLDWARNGTSNIFMLRGRGGTGKTTVINVLLSELGVSPTNVTFVTPTNKAKKVLRNANSKSPYGRSAHYTAAQVLGIKPDTDDQGNQTFVQDPYAEKPELGKIIVVDEASMLHSENYDGIMERAEEYGAKVIFMGDNAQLPPIKDKRSPIKSVVFEDTKDNTVTLTELMRQGEDSPIINFTSYLIKLAEKIEQRLERGNSDKTTKEKLRAVVFDGKDLNNFDKDSNEGLVLTNSFFEDILPAFIRDYKESPTSTKVITFNTYTTDIVIQMHNMIRETLYGEKAEKEIYIKGEPLVLHAPYLENAEDPDSRLDNGEEFTVVDYRKVKKRVKYLIGKSLNLSAQELEMYEVDAIDNNTKEKVTFRVPVSKKAVNMIVEAEKVVLRKKGRNPKSAHMIKESLAMKLSYGYVITSHKAQGSSYDNVYMDLGNILSQRYANSNTMIKSTYVAASRPRKKLVVIDSRTSGNQLNDPKPGHEVEGKPLLFNNVDNGEANDIINQVNKCKE